MLNKDFNKVVKILSNRIRKMSYCFCFDSTKIEVPKIQRCRRINESDNFEFFNIEYPMNTIGSYRY